MTIIYDCGCSASGGANLPTYCATHGTPGDSEAARTRTESAAAVGPRTVENSGQYQEYLKAREADGKPAYVSQAFLRAMNATGRELAEVDAAMGTPQDGTDEDAHAYRLHFIKRAARLLNEDDEPDITIGGKPRA